MGVDGVRTVDARRRTRRQTGKKYEYAPKRLHLSPVAAKNPVYQRTTKLHKAATKFTSWLRAVAQEQAGGGGSAESDGSWIHSIRMTVVHKVKGNNEKRGARTKAVPEPSESDLEREAKRW